MKFIQIKKHKTYEYKGLTIGIWKTANKSFIREGYLGYYLGDLKKLSDKDKEIALNFKYIYFWDFINLEGSAYLGFLGDSQPIFSVVDSYRSTEEEALNLAKETIDRQLHNIELEELGIELPTHFYDRSSGKVVRMSATSNKEYDPQKSQVSFNYCGSRIIISV